jgi:HK97 family phage major capsid protein
MKSKELRERRANIAEEMKALVMKKDSNPDGCLTPEQCQQFDRQNDEIDNLQRQIESMERTELFESKLVESTRSLTTTAERIPTLAVRPQDRDDAMKGWIANQFVRLGKRGEGDLTERVRGVSDQFRDKANRVGLDYDSNTLSIELNPVAPRNMNEAIRSASGQSSLTAGLGGEFVPSTWSSQVETYLLAYAEVRRYAKVLRTPDGGPFKQPIVNDVNQQSVIIAQAATDAVLDMPTATATLNAYMLTTGLITIPIELVRDSKYPIQQVVMEALGVRHARGCGFYLTQGTGPNGGFPNGQPQGFVSGVYNNGSPSNPIRLTKDINTVTYQDILDLKFNCPGAYRTQPSAAFVASDSCVKAFRAIVSTTNFPLWQPSLQVNEPDTLLGHPVITNWQMDAMGKTNAFVCVFGAWEHFLVRDVATFEVIVDPWSKYSTNREIVLSGHGAIDSVVLAPQAFSILETPSASSFSGT